MTLKTAAAVALVLAVQPVCAGEGGFDGRIRVGGTGVMCVREPCPRIGVMAAAGEKSGGRLTRPLYAGSEPPETSGAAPDVAAVREAWTADGCLVVDGRFTRPNRLAVRRVVGPCGPKD